METRSERDIQEVQDKVKKKLDLEIGQDKIQKSMDKMKKMGEHHLQEYLKEVKENFPEDVAMSLPEIYKTAKNNPSNLVAYLKEYGQEEEYPVLAHLNRKLEEIGEERFCEMVRNAIFIFAMEKGIALEKTAREMKEFGIPKKSARKILEIIEQTWNEKEGSSGKHPIDYQYHI